MAKTKIVKRKRTVFSVRTKPGSEVIVAGTFNNWDTVSNKKKVMKDETGNGDFVKTLVLPYGHHEYKFYINGEWVADDKAHWVHNELGTLNSVIDI